MTAPVLAVAASSAGADTSPAAGSIEICKASAAAPNGVTGTFTFTYAQGSSTLGTTTLTVKAGGPTVCTAPISIASAGNVTITETLHTWFSVSSITGAPGSSYIVGTPSLSTGTVVVSISPTTTSMVTYTNKLVTGFVEICKATPSGSGLTGSYGFNLSFAPDSFTTSATALVGSCTAPITVPAVSSADGGLTITEAGTNLYVTGLTATFNGTGNAFVGTPNTVTGTANVVVNPSSDASNQTDVTFTNNVVSLKICKTFTGTIPTGVTSFPFSFAVSGVAGPAGPTSAISVANNTCQIAGVYRPGTQVVITEGLTPGTKVGAITPSGALSVVPNSLSTLNGTVTVLIGTSTTSGASAPGNEAVVTYNDIPALPGQLKICKTAATTPSPVTFSTATFTVTGVTGTVSIPVTAGATNCTIVGSMPFAAPVTVTETGLSSTNVVSAISVLPTFLEEETSAGPPPVFSATTTPTLVGTASLTSGTVTVLMSEGNTTEVDFTDTDPPVAPVNGGTLVSNPDGSGVTLGATGSVATTVAGGVATEIANAPTTVASNTVNPSVFTSSLSSTSVKKLTAAQRKALLKHDEKSLSNVKATISKFSRILSHTKANSAAHKAAAKRLVQLRDEQHVLNIEIALLK